MTGATGCTATQYVTVQSNTTAPTVTVSSSGSLTCALAITTVAGTGTAGFSVDGGPATAAQLAFPAGVSVDGSGNLYIADHYNHRIRRVSSSGVITTIAGTGTAGFSGDDGAATSAQLNFPTSTAMDGSGNLYIADLYNYRVRRMSSSGVISTVAGTGSAGFGGDGGRATSAPLAFPISVAVDGSGNLYIADQNNNRIRKVCPSTGILISPTSVTLTAGGGTTYQFSGPGVVSQSGNVAIVNIGGTYSVTATGSSGCTASQSLVVVSRTPPSASCSQMATVKAGNWNDPGVWSCGRVPISSDAVQVNHAVSLPASYAGQVLLVRYGSGGQVVFNTGSQLRLGM